MRIFNALDLYACCAGIMVYLDPVTSLAINKKMVSNNFSIDFFLLKMYLIKGISKDIYNTTTKLQDVPNHYRQRIIFRLLMHDISNRGTHYSFKEHLQYSLLATNLYITIEFVG